MEKLIIYDGDCGICSRSADFAMSRNKNLKAAPYQDEELLERLNISREAASKSVHFIIGSRVYRGAEAVSRILKEMAGIWKIAGYAIGLPAIKFFSEIAYRFIAKRRRKISVLLGMKACKINY